jgi:hypothetical protein
MRELKRQLAIKVKKFENEIKRARWTFDNIRETLERGDLVPISETNYAIFDQAINSAHGNSMYQSFSLPSNKNTSKNFRPQSTQQ